jgi:hypothetical protein
VVTLMINLFAGLFKVDGITSCMCWGLHSLHGSHWYTVYILTHGWHEENCTINVSAIQSHIGIIVGSALVTGFTRLTTSQFSSVGVYTLHTEPRLTLMQMSTSGSLGIACALLVRSLGIAWA